MLPEKTYSIYFFNLDGSINSEQEYTSFDDAWRAFRLFFESRSFDIYSHIDLVRYDWTVFETQVIAYLKSGTGKE